MSVTEQELSAAAVAPRVTLADVEGFIAAEHYFTAGNAADYLGQPKHQSLDLLTFCVLVLNNGFTVHGSSACASPENFNPEIGNKLARANAVNQIWPLLGFELRSKLCNLKRDAEDNWLDRLKAERHELLQKMVKLAYFIDSPGFTSTVDEETQKDLRDQYMTMSSYYGVLGRRLGKVEEAADASA